MLSALRGSWKNMAWVSPTGGAGRAATAVPAFPLADETVLETGWNRFRPPFIPAQHQPDEGGSARLPDARGPEAWERRARLFGVDANRGSETFGAALVLLAGLEVGHNVDRIARRAGLARPFVSKCARRLIDNGVWSAGSTVARWIADPAAGDAFVRDVAVAEGRLLRRIGSGGRMEWAVAGAWTKHFEGGSTEEDRLSVTWTDSPQREAEAVPLAFEREDSAVNAPVLVAEVIQPTAAAPVPAVEVPEPVLEEADEEDSTETEQGPGPEAPSLEQVFSDAVWLR